MNLEWKQALNWIFTLLWIAIFGRVILSWIFPRGEDPLSRFFFIVTEPILGPVRKMLPSFGGLDLSPMVVIFLLNFVQRVLGFL